MFTVVILVQINHWLAVADPFFLRLVLALPLMLLEHRVDPSPRAPVVHASHPQSIDEFARKVVLLQLAFPVVGLALRALRLLGVVEL